jgi:integrase
VEDAKRFLKVVEGDRLYAFYVLITTTAMRRGEALGLQKKHLLLSEKVVQVRTSLAYIRKKGLTLGEPKSKSSKRDIVLTQFAVDALKNHLEYYPNTSGYVFATGNNTPFSPRNVLRHFKSKLSEAGLPQEVRLHDLRHSVISWLLASSKISIKDAQALAGHAQASTTIGIYAHLLPDYQRKTATAIEGLFSTE